MFRAIGTRRYVQNNTRRWAFDQAHRGGPLISGLLGLEYVDFI